MLNTKYRHFGNNTCVQGGRDRAANTQFSTGYITNFQKVREMHPPDLCPKTYIFLSVSFQVASHHFTLISSDWLSYL